MPPPRASASSGTSSRSTRRTRLSIIRCCGCGRWSPALRSAATARSASPAASRRSDWSSRSRARSPAAGPRRFGSGRLLGLAALLLAALMPVARRDDARGAALSGDDPRLCRHPARLAQARPHRGERATHRPRPVRRLSDRPRADAVAAQSRPAYGVPRSASPSSRSSPGPACRGAIGCCSSPATCSSRSVWLPALLILADQAPTWVHSTWLKFSFDAMLWRLALLWAAPGTIPTIAAAILGLAALATLAAPARGLAAAARARPARRPADRAVDPAVGHGRAGVHPAHDDARRRARSRPARDRRGRPRPAVALADARRAGDPGDADGGDRSARARRAGRCRIGTARSIGSPARYRPGDQVWAYPNEGALPFDYAVRDRRLSVATRPIPTPIPTLDGGPGAWNPTGSRGVFSLPPARLAAIADSGRARADDLAPPPRRQRL